MNNMTKRRAKKIALREWELVKAAVDKDIKEKTILVFLVMNNVLTKMREKIYGNW